MSNMYLLGCPCTRGIWGPNKENAGDRSTVTDCRYTRVLHLHRSFPFVSSQSPANSNTGSNFSNASSKSFTRNMAIALYDCRAEVDDELTFKCGDVLVLTKLESGDDWLEGRLHAKVCEHMRAVCAKGKKTAQIVSLGH